MIREVRSRSSTSPEVNFTEAVCDACRSACPGSRRPGRGGSRAWGEAVELAREAGWLEVETPDPRPERGVPSATIRLLCPSCAGGAQTKRPRGS